MGHVLHVGVVNIPCPTNLVFCSCVLEARIKASETNEASLLIKCL